MFRIFRRPQRGEFFVIGGDCSQGGEDQNYAQFLSKSKLDFPIVYSSNGVAASMTTAIHPFLEWLHDVTGIPPVVAFERNNGGASEMERLQALNRLNKYVVYTMKKHGIIDAEKDTNKYGWDTNQATRPVLVSDWKHAVDNKLATLYDEPTILQHKVFIVNKVGKPEAAKGKHDDAVIACAIAWQLYQTESPRQVIQSWQRPVYTPNDSVIGV